MSPKPADKRSPRGRYAPSPSGLSHLGNARTALLAWLSVRSRQGSFVLRIEDLDGPRVVEGMAEAAIEDLAWLGLDWDEGPDREGPCAPYLQSRRFSHYEHALRKLAEAGRLFPCRRSRKDLLSLASAPHREGGAPRAYPASLRPAVLAPDWFERLAQAPAPDASIRFRVEPGAVAFEDAVQGACEERVDRTVGDFVLKRRDGLYAYQLAVVVDDWLMGIDEVVRGSDLLDSTARQIQLIAALGAAIPAYAHPPLLLQADGNKLSKRDRVPSLRSLREAGVAGEQVVGYLAYSAGLTERARACRPRDLIAEFSWSRVSREDWVLPPDLCALLASIG